MQHVEPLSNLIAFDLISYLQDLIAMQNFMYEMHFLAKPSMSFTLREDEISLILFNLTVQHFFRIYHP